MDFPAQYVRPEDARVRAAQYREAGRKVVLATGIFDLLHAGHAGLLSQAKRADDEVLFVGINTDEQARELKGPGHPIIPVGLRVVMLAALRWVDAVTTFDQPTPEFLIRQIRPAVYVKGDDYGPGRLPLPELDELDYKPRLRVLSGFHPIRTTSIIARVKLAK